MSSVVVAGTVIRGDGYGRTIGFPTANIDRKQYVRAKLDLKHGVYAGEVIMPSKKSYSAGIVIGPKDRKGLPKLEAYLIGFKGSLYGKKLTFRLIKYLRPFKRYSTEQLLQRQIANDIKQIKKLIK
jgi:riboflavin kinase/FMN adenylyltransferase